MIDLFICRNRHFNTAITLVSQTIDDLIAKLYKKSDEAVEKARNVYNLCDIKQIFHHESVSDKMIDFHWLTPSEQILHRDCPATRSAHSRSMTGKSLALHVNDYEVHVLDGDLNPGEYLVDQRYIDADDIEYLAEKGRVDDYDIPDPLLEDAGVRTSPQEADDWDSSLRLDRTGAKACRFGGYRFPVCWVAEDPDRLESQFGSIRASMTRSPNSKQRIQRATKS